MGRGRSPIALAWICVVLLAASVAVQARRDGVAPADFRFPTRLLVTADPCAGVTCPPPGRLCQAGGDTCDPATGRCGAQTNIADGTECGPDGGTCLAGVCNTGAYAGCFADPAPEPGLELLGADEAGMTVEACLALAQQEGLTYAGLTNSAACLGGDDVSFYRPAAPGECDRPCAGNPMQVCGGASAVTIYTTWDLCAGDPCNGFSPPCRTDPTCNPATGMCMQDGGDKVPDDTECPNGICKDGECKPDLCTAMTCEVPPGSCRANGTCDPLSGSCVDGPALPDGTECGFSSVCREGSCILTNLCADRDCSVLFPSQGSCYDNKVCDYAGECVPGVKLPNGTACTRDDGVSGLCHDGVCTELCFGVTCPAGPCEVAGTCDPLTGQCGVPAGNAPDGTACDPDGGICKAGVCTTGVYVGCFEEPLCDYGIDERALEQLRVDEAGMTVEACLALARQQDPPYMFAALLDGTQCWAGDDITSYRTNGICDKPCAGNTQQTCGGECAVDIFATTNHCAGVTCPAPSNPCKATGMCNPTTGKCGAQTNKPNGAECPDGGTCQAGVCRKALCASETCPPPGRPCQSGGDICNPATGQCSAPTGNIADGTECGPDGGSCQAGVCNTGTYIGCFQEPACSSDVDERDLVFLGQDDAGMTVEACLALARQEEFPYAAIQGPSLCFGGDDISVYTTGGTCAAACPGNPMQKCGGDCSYSIYTTRDLCAGVSCKAERCRQLGACERQTGRCSRGAELANTTACVLDNGKKGMCRPGGVCTDLCQGVKCKAIACRQAGTCEPQTGVCSQGAEMANTTACVLDNGKKGMCRPGGVCTDLCQGITCKAATCREAGTCEPQTGVCSQGAEMSNTISCLLDNGKKGMCRPGGVCTDLCQGITCKAIACREAGTCEPQTGVCSQGAEMANTISCVLDNGKKGMCRPGGVCADLCQDITCKAAACREAGTCEPQTGVCSQGAEMANTTICVLDNRKKGMCRPGGVCTDLCSGFTCKATSCRKAGKCNAQTGVCSQGAAKASTTSCVLDNGKKGMCRSGVCKDLCQGVTCEATSCREAGVCDSQTGVCSQGAEMANTTTCMLDNGNKGMCRPGGVCVDLCAEVSCEATSCVLAGTCEPTTGVCSTGEPMSDTTSCSLPDNKLGMCRGGTCTDLCANVTCPPVTSCQKPIACVAETGKCSKPKPKKKGTKCTDSQGNAGTCSGGTCVTG